MCFDLCASSSICYFSTRNCHADLVKQSTVIHLIGLKSSRGQRKARSAALIRGPNRWLQDDSRDKLNLRIHSLLLRIDTSYQL